MSNLPASIDITNVQKRYKGRVQALRGIDLKVTKGEIFGLLGPNGAGKSTLLKILLTIIKPNRCGGVMLGQPIGHKPTLRKVGYLPEHAQFPEYLTGRQVIRYSAGLSGVCSKFCKKREEELLDFVGMRDWAGKKMRTYSKGMKQRIGLAQALVNDPEIVFLDEPTDGVDPQGRREMRNVLKFLREQGKTVFVNSHLLGELEMVCDSVAILNQGQLVKQGSLKELQAASNRFEVNYSGAISSSLKEKLERIPHLSFGEKQLDIETRNAHAVQEVIDLLRAENLTIEEMTRKKQSLEDFFMDAVSETGPGGYRG